MKTLLFAMLAVATVLCVQAQDNAQVNCVIKLELTPKGQTNLVEKSVALLSSCAYMDKNLPDQLENIKKKSHLDFIFTSPRTVNVPTVKTTVKVKEMVISLPLIVGGIWVRAEEGDFYFTKYQHSNSQEVNELLKEAQRL